MFNILHTITLQVSLNPVKVKEIDIGLYILWSRDNNNTTTSKPETPLQRITSLTKQSTHVVCLYYKTRHLTFTFILGHTGMTCLSPTWENLGTKEGAKCIEI